MMTEKKTAEERKKSRKLFKIRKGIYSVGMICFCMFAGCGKQDASASADPAGEEFAETDNAAEDAEMGTEENAAREMERTNEDDAAVNAGYVFERDGVQITVDMDMSEILDQLEEPNSSYEQPSCAAQGIARIYAWPGFEIETYPDGDVDRIACIVLKDDTVATAEGVDLSMTKADIIAVYGSDYEESETGMVYGKDGAKLCFILDGDDISSIEYDSPVLN